MVAIEERSWYRVAQEEGSLRKRCHAGLEDATEKIMQEDEMRKRRKAAELSSEVSSSQPGEATALPFKCDTCQRAFRCRQDIARHRCVTTRPKSQMKSRPPVCALYEGHLFNLPLAEEHQRFLNNLH